MKYFSIIFMLSGLMLLSSCDKKKNQQAAHLRAVSFIPNAEATLYIQPAKTKSQIQRITLSSEYQTFQPGYYKIFARVNGHTILEHTYVLGEGARYTFTIAGLMPQYPDSVSNTWKYQLTHIFAGHEARVANSYLPIGFILYDSYFGNRSEAILRVTNAAPNAPKVTVKSNEKTIAKKLSYPKSTAITYVKPGVKTLKAYYGNIKLASKKINVKAGYLYNIFVGSGKKNGASLSITILKNRTKALRN